MAIETVVVCAAQVPFVRGGAEYLVDELVRQLRGHGYRAELVNVPFKWYPKEEILAHAAAWRLLDLCESNGRPIDLAIGTKFPTYFVRHPRKVTWLVHQYRAAYELVDTPYSDFFDVDGDVGLRARLIDLDRQMIGESERVFTIARTVSDRLRRYNGLEAPPLYHPPRLAPRLRPGPYGDYVLSVGRVESIKRVDLLVAAMPLVDPGIRLVVAGEGSQLEAAGRLAESAGVADRVAFLGSVDDDEVVALYAGALAVGFTPFAEDYGYVTLEAFCAARPVITTRDAGGPLEFVEDGVNGFVCDPDPEAIAAAINRVGADRRLAAALGEAGRERMRAVTWDGVVDRLLGLA
jgi:glycosyltransferase involved in cell wall biosynthesis